jgi:hypothetical protein
MFIKKISENFVFLDFIINIICYYPSLKIIGTAIKKVNTNSIIRLIKETERYELNGIV